MRKRFGLSRFMYICFEPSGLQSYFIVNSKNKWTLSPLGFDPDLSGPVGAGLSR